MSKDDDDIEAITLIQGLVHCAAVIIDRLVENGLLDRDEVDAALQAVEDRMLIEAIVPPKGFDARGAITSLTAPARILRAVNALGREGKILSNAEIEPYLRGEA